ncbi:uncharacterized protein NEMAJ01_1774 [Nematocida major]|uniref:uncharacterized protein n=1 Tax=Nematocida major TaxID=1912982 RepID=UPI0020084DBB|nr:uncharacterized protein NEMAJ01_1774 [Nematocida major]KAH9386878.1 hypothetical protein NEMAJ01_1774 [Nematocida major]
MDAHENSHTMSIYDTIEHDMRHSKEYLANIKFNFIEVLHKSIFLKRLRGQEESEGTGCKEALVGAKKQIEDLRKQFEKTSHDVAFLRGEAEKHESMLRTTKEKEMILKKRIDEITQTEKTLSAFSEIKKDHEVRAESIRKLRLKIEDAENKVKACRQATDAKDVVRESLVLQKTDLQARLKDLQQTANQQLVYQYNWHKQFVSVFYKLVGIRVIDVRQNVHKHQETTYSSAENREQKKKEDINEISIKLLAKRDERTVVITLIFVDDKIHSYTVHKTEGVAQIEPLQCDLLFEYCKKMNSIKHFIFESFHQQLSSR